MSTSSSFVGLRNQGATCYLNSLIQTLFLTPEFRMELFSLTQHEVGLMHRNSENKGAIKLKKRKKIIVELQKLFARLQCPDFIGSYCSDFALSTKSLTNSFGWNAAQVTDQHDINELYNLLLDGIERQMPENKKILNKYYKGRIINVIECTQCGYKSQRKEDFVQLNVILQTMQSSFDDLQASLLSMYMDNEEELKNDNAYFCPTCCDKVTAKKYCRLIKLPSIMVCNLNRFYYDLKSGERVKINKKFKFPKSLDLSLFIQNEFNEMEKETISEYDLIGIVVHRGSGANAGHYHAFIRDMNNEVEWKPVKRNKRRKQRRRPRRNNNRNKQKEAHSDKERKKKEKKEEATAVLVSILSEHEVLTKNRLQNLFKKSTNLDGWYTYKNFGLGTFADFVRNNHRFKIIDAEKRTFSVCLANDIHQNKNNKNDLNGFIASDDDIDNDDDEYIPPETTNSAQETKEESLALNYVEEEEVKYNKNDAHWFDFNDEDITAVFDKEIDHLYDGGDEECPYMVIYRRKCMNTGNWPPEIPPFVSSLLIDEPLDAEEDKKEIRIAIRKLTIATKLVRENGEFLSDTESKEENETNDDQEKEEEDDEDIDISMMSISSNKEIIVLSSDSDETAEKLICKSPSKTPSNEIKKSETKKRKYEEFAQNDTKHNDEPQKKKRKISETASSQQQQSSLANLPDPNSKKRGKRKRRNHAQNNGNNNNNNKNNKKKMEEYVKTEYLEPINMTKGSTTHELYESVSEWSGIELKHLEIAQILCKGRKYAKNPIVLNLNTKEKHMKLKRIPINNMDDILVWDSSKFGSELAQKELLRRNKCIALNVYILKRQYPQIIYVNARKDKLCNVCDIIYEQLNVEEKELILNKGRFRDVDTHEIYRDMNKKTLYNLKINADTILRYDAASQPKANEIVIRYRLKTKDISAKESDEKECYIANTEDISTLFLLMTNEFNVDPNKFDLRKGRSDWALSVFIDREEKCKIKECKFDKTQRLILAENNVNKNMRSLDIYCETYLDEENMKRFKIAKHLLCDDEDDDVEMKQNNTQEEEEKEVVKHDALDVYDCNSEILCTLNIDRFSNGFDIKQAIINQRCMKMNTVLKEDIDPLYLRISILTKTGSRTKWHILNGNKEKTSSNIGRSNGKCIVEFLDAPKKDIMFGNKASGKALIFVHKKIVNNEDNNASDGAIYGSRYELTITQTQREKLEALKTRIIAQCDFDEEMQASDVVLASRNILNHRWSIITEKEVKPKRNSSVKNKNKKTKKMIITPKLYDRDIVAVVCLKDINNNNNNNNGISSHIFETKFDRYFAKKYEKEIKIQFDSDEDEPALKINFINNDSQEDDDNNEENKNGDDVVDEDNDDENVADTV